MVALEGLAKIFLLVVVWALLALPIFIAAFFVGRTIKRRRLNSFSVTISFAVIVAALIAPVPTPIITFFVPNGFTLFAAMYYERVLSKDAFFSQLLPWIAVSLAVTLVVVSAVVLRYVGVDGEAEGKDV